MVCLPRTASVGALALCFATACLFPEYTFNDTEPSGGSSTGGQGGAPNTGAGGSGATGGDGGTGAAPPPTENCLVAGDEDDDGLEDCGDPDCDPEVECVDPIPVGWGTFGYAALFRGSPAGDPACPDGTAATEVYTGNGNLLNTEADCTSCGCDTPMDRTCELTDDLFDPTKPGIQPFRTRDTFCGIAATNFTTLTVPGAWDGMCSELDVAPGGGACPGASCNRSVEVQAAQLHGGSCVATGGVPSGGDPTWGEAVKACRAETTLGGCDAGKTCVLRPQAQFEPRICVGKSGDQTCPAGFGLRSEAFADFADTRDCSDCTCGGPAGGVCKVTLSLFSDVSPTACATALPIVVESGDCVDTPSNPRISGRTSAVTMPPSGGSCPSTGGGVPSGEATPSGQTTFCCLPTE